MLNLGMLVFHRGRDVYRLLADIQTETDIERMRVKRGKPSANPGCVHSAYGVPCSCSRVADDASPTARFSAMKQLKHWDK